MDSCFLICCKNSHHICIFKNWHESSPIARETGVPSLAYQRLKKMVLDTALLNTQHYKVRIKGKVEQSRERSSALPYTLVEKGTFGSSSTTVVNFTTYYIYIYIYIYKFMWVFIYIYIYIITRCEFDHNGSDSNTLA